MILQPWGFPDCSLRAIPDGHCDICMMDHCALHHRDQHTCSTLEREAQREVSRLVYARYKAEQQAAIDSLDVVKSAETFRPGHRVANFVKAIVNDLPNGCFNVHVPIEFEDGVRWIPRIHKVGYRALPRLLGRIMMQGEVDVLGWLKSVAGVPVARVLSPIVSDGITDFYFQELLPGNPYEYGFFLTIPPLQLANTITDLAKIMIRISDHPFRGSGSLYLDPSTNEYSVGPFINYWKGETEPPYYPGPFKTAGEKWAFLYAGQIRDIQARELYPGHTELAFCVFSWIRDSILAYPPFNTECDSYVMHADSKADIIMTDGDEGRISVLIDWEGASIGIGFEAFAAPCGLMDDDAMYEGGNQLSPAESLLMETYISLGRPDLAKCVEGGKTYQRLEWLMSGGMAWKMYPQLLSLGESMGMVMPETMEEFEAELKEIYKEGVAAMKA